MDAKNDLIKPTQPFFVLETDNFMQEIYLKQGISHFYAFSIDEDKDLTTVPDGCIDLLFEYHENDCRAYACGTVIKHGVQHWDKGREIFGVRFMPGFLPAGINVVLKDLIEKRLVLDDILEDRTLVKRVAGEKDFYSRIRVFIEEYTKLERKREKPYGKMELVMAVKNMVYMSEGQIKVSELSERTGYSERYINKVFIEIMGFSPKTFCKIIQFQKAIEFLNYGKVEKMTKAAVDLGYYDQPKFIKDFKEYAGITPNRYQKLISSEHYKDRIKNYSDLYNFG